MVQDFWVRHWLKKKKERKKKKKKIAICSSRKKKVCTCQFRSCCEINFDLSPPVTSKSKEKPSLPSLSSLASLVPRAFVSVVRVGQIRSRRINDLNKRSRVSRSRVRRFEVAPRTLLELRVKERKKKKERHVGQLWRLSSNPEHGARSSGKRQISWKTVARSNVSARARLSEPPRRMNYS